MGQSRRFGCVALLAVALSLPAPASAAADRPGAEMAQAGAARALGQVLNAQQRELYARAFAAAELGRWEDARALADAGGSAIGRKILRWMELQERGTAAFDDIARFIAAEPEWPGQDALARRAEEALALEGDDARVLAWFRDRAPTTVDGAIRLADALFRAGDNARGAQTVRNAWRGGGFGPLQERQFVAKYGTLLGKDDHRERLDRLLWEGRRDEARRMLKLADAGDRAVAEARLRLQSNAPGVEGAIRTVPAVRQNDPGLLFDRVRWRRTRGMDDAAIDLMRNLPRNLGRPELWWNERAVLARRALGAGNAREAYRLVRDHRIASGPNVAEAEFLAGWIALRFLKDAKSALQHFDRLHDVARFPVTRARGAYWAARAAEAAGDRRTAGDWYRRAAAHATTYYGQLAISSLDRGQRPAWPETPVASAAEREAFEGGELALAARLLSEVGANDRVRAFVNRLVALARTPVQHALAAELGLALGRPDLAVVAAKRSAQSAGIALPREGWPVIALPDGNEPERPLVLSVIRQESQFEPAVVSRAGARGLMQLMPATARTVAQELGVNGGHSSDRLLRDPPYNILLGRTYLASMIDEFGGSYVLAVAAYNAGPSRVRQWLRDLGDPRAGGPDVIDWIEMIPFEETRNYVQRVLENLQVYRWRLGGAVRADLADDLNRRRI